MENWIVQTPKVMPDLDLPRTTYIVLPNLESIVPNFVRIACRPAGQDWNVQGLEFYNTEGDARRGGHDGFQTEVDFDKLPQAAQFAAWGALNDWAHQQRQKKFAAHVMSSRVAS